jgi:hypothetical protein
MGKCKQHAQQNPKATADVAADAVPNKSEAVHVAGAVQFYLLLAPAAPAQYNSLTVRIGSAAATPAAVMPAPSNQRTWRA